jgi:hypothetical protein
MRLREHQHEEERGYRDLGQESDHESVVQGQRESLEQRDHQGGQDSPELSFFRRSGKFQSGSNNDVGNVLQLSNKSPFKPAIAVFPDPRGVDTLYVAIKATFDLNPTPAIAEAQVDPVVADVYWADPNASSLRYPSDIHLTKPVTDVVMISRAWPPGGQRVAQMDVRFSVAEKQKVLRVFGNRVRTDSSITYPVPFESMPIVYEYAFGGIHEVDPATGEVLGEGRNPIGKGFRGKRKDREMQGMLLPNVEDPRCLVTEVGDKAVPAGFAPVAPAWLPRRDYAGTYDEAWQTGRAPYLPVDFDPRFFCIAPPDFNFGRYLVGGEPVQLDNLHRNGPLAFTLPQCRLQAAVRVAGKTETPPLNLETVLIEPEKNRLCLTWRGALPCDKKALKIEQVEISLLEFRVDGGRP